ncbi:MAG: hypothetical protein U0414_13225 [Polyangiaceae bacterium]
MSRGYKIPDEPEPSAVSHFTADVHWIVTAGMIGGNWLAAPWFAFNAYAVGSATRRREYALALALPVTTMLVGMALRAAVLHFQWPSRVVAYGALVVFALKFTLLYELQRRQAVSVGVHTYLGRKKLNGAALVAAGYLLRSVVIQAAFGVSPWLGWAVI